MTLDIPTLTKCKDIDSYNDGQLHVMKLTFATEDERQDYEVKVEVDPVLVLHGPSAVAQLFAQQREALPEASRAAWDEAVAKISVAA